MKFLKTQRGGEACNFDGFSYRIDKIGIDKKIWRCMKRECTGQLWTTISNIETIVKKVHTHVANEVFCTIKKVVSEMKAPSKFCGVYRIIWSNQLLFKSLLSFEFVLRRVSNYLVELVAYYMLLK